MKYTVIANSDIGNTMSINQDSLLIKHISYKEKEVLMTIMCDGMGGLSKGELASSTIVHYFNRWFDSTIQSEINNLDFRVIACKWKFILKDLNNRIQNYSNQKGIKMGSTFTGVLFVDEQFVIVHVGDTRVYFIDSEIHQLTEDHTVVAEELRKGLISFDQADKDKRKHSLYQCIGASKNIHPQIYYGTSQKGMYLLCSDEFRNTLSQEELLTYFDENELSTTEDMKQRIDRIFQIVKSRGERDNISAILIKFDDC